MFVVLGATGNTGSAVVETLLNRKQSVRIIVRSTDKGAGWKAKGADVAVASLDDVPALTKAFEGATGSYLMVPPNYGQQPGCRTNRPAWIAPLRQSRKVGSAMWCISLPSVGSYRVGLVPSEPFIMVRGN